MFDDVVTPPLGVLRICVAVLRDVTVLVIAPPSLSYELTGRRLPDCGRSHTFRSTAFRRPACFTTSRLFAPNSPRSVPKSVPNTANSTSFPNWPQRHSSGLQWCNPAARGCVIPVDADADCQRRRNRFDHLTPSRTRTYFRCPATTSKPRRPVEIVPLGPS
jgi:hypothetical protein